MSLDHPVHCAECEDARTVAEARAEQAEAERADIVERGVRAWRAAAEFRWATHVWREELRAAETELERLRAGPCPVCGPPKSGLLLSHRISGTDLMVYRPCPECLLEDKTVHP